jgi:hypothetical protein
MYRVHSVASLASLVPRGRRQRGVPTLWPARLCVRTHACNAVHLHLPETRTALASHTAVSESGMQAIVECGRQWAGCRERWACWSSYCGRRGGGVGHADVMRRQTAREQHEERDRERAERDARAHTVAVTVSGTQTSDCLCTAAGMHSMSTTVCLCQPADCTT